MNYNKNSPMKAELTTTRPSASTSNSASTKQKNKQNTKIQPKPPLYTDGIYNI